MKQEQHEILELIEFFGGILLLYIAGILVIILTILKLTPADYYNLNKAISSIKGYDLTKDTQRYVDMNPQSDGEFVYMPVDVETKKLLKDVLQIMEQVDSFPVQYDEEGNIIQQNDTIVDVEGLLTDDVDWTLIHYEKVGKKDIEVICLLDDPRSSESDEAVQKLIKEGITIIIVE